MYFKTTYRPNTKSGKSDWYNRLVESYRNALGELRQRTVLSVSDFSGDQIDLIEKPQEKVTRIYDALKYQCAPFIRKNL